MATQVQFRRGTTAQSDAFTGASGEININTDNSSIRVHNGSTQGGVELARADLSNASSVGILTATAFYGDGSNLTGIDATALKDSGGNVKVQANPNGAVITGVTTSTSFSGPLTGDVTGNADTATALATSRTISLTGDVSGSASFDGSANASITVTIADDSHNHVISNVDGLQAALDLKAPLASPALTGTPTAPTATVGTATTQIATTAFVSTAVANVIDSAPGALDTLNELAAALGDDANFSSTVTNSLALKAPLASPALTGTPTAPTAAADTNTTQVATTAYVQTELNNLNATNITSGTISDDRLPATITSNITGNVTGNADTATTATTATNITCSANNSTDETTYIVFVDGATGDQGAETDTALNYNPSTNTLAAGNFNSTSDISLKKDIEVISDTHEILSQIRGVKFTWKETDKHSTGVIAQDVEQVLPELVDVSSKGIKSVNYQGLIGVLIEAVKDQQKQIDALKEEINSLKS